MRSKLLRLTFACVAFVAGVSVATIHRYVHKQRSVEQAEVSAPPASQLPVSKDPCPSYPETSGLTPREILNFIDDHPQAKLDGLWQRLKVTDDAGNVVPVSLIDICASVQANIFYEFETIYNFDSMGEDDFLTFNRDELRAIAAGRDSEKKAWLKEFLDTCEDSPFKRELLRSLS